MSRGRPTPPPLIILRDPALPAITLVFVWGVRQHVLLQDGARKSFPPAGGYGASPRIRVMVTPAMDWLGLALAMPVRAILGRRRVMSCSSRESPRV